MYKKTISYTDFDGNERTEDFYFNLTASELTKRELITPGGWSNQLEKISKSNDPAEIITAFNEIIDMAYGVKSDDGRSFKKSKQITDDFKQTAAYDELMMSFLTDTDSAVEFVNAIIPDVSKYTANASQPNLKPVK